LIIAPKDKPDLDDGPEYNARVLFLFDREKEKLLDEPFLIFTEKDIEYFVSNHSKVDKIDNFQFKPSGVAVHPITGDTYILSSVGKGLLVVDNEGMFINLYFIPNKKMRQPEGIAFSPDGTLYIASEGDDAPGELYVFNPIK
jgi:uncharacterized protein YjiK